MGDSSPRPYKETQKNNGVHHKALDTLYFILLNKYKKIKLILNTVVAWHMQMLVCDVYTTDLRNKIITEAHDMMLFFFPLQSFPKLRKETVKKEEPQQINRGFV